MLFRSDPDPGTKGWQSNTRGLSYVFGADVVHEICQKLDIDMIVRAHQVVQDGYEFFADRKLITLFSAPHYCGNIIFNYQNIKNINFKYSYTKLSV